MKKTFILGSLLTSTLLFGSFTPKNSKTDVNFPSKIQKADTYIVDIDKSKIFWACKGVGKEHTGYVTIQSGSVLIDTKTINSGFVYINMKSIVNTDIKDAGFNKNLVDHLKSKDFFASATYQTSTLKIIKTQRLDVPEGQPNYKINGELTIKGIKKPIEFMSTIKYNKKSIAITGDVTINRTDWDIKYNSGSFFQDLADKLIEDNINFKLDIYAEIK
jgi:polyisoprenoid-binding protein YceI